MFTCSDSALCLYMAGHSFSLKQYVQYLAVAKLVMTSNQNCHYNSSVVEWLIPTWKKVFIFLSKKGIWSSIHYTLFNHYSFLMQTCSCETFLDSEYRSTHLLKYINTVFRKYYQNTCNVSYTHVIILESIDRVSSNAKPIKS